MSAEAPFWTGTNHDFLRGEDVLFRRVSVGTLPDPSLDEVVYLSIQYYMSKSVHISEEFHEYITSHKRDDETMEETLRRLIGGPHPEAVAGILSSDTADAMRDRLDTKYETDTERKRELRERFE